MLALLAILAAAPQPPGPLMAVLEFRSKLKGVEREQVDAAYLTDVVRSAALKQIGGLRVMTRENMLVLLQGSGKKAEDCEGGCEVETGRLLGADLVITGDVLKFGSAYKLNLRLHETRDGRLLSGSQASGRTVDELDQSLQAAVADLLAPVKAAPIVPAPVVVAPPPKPAEQKPPPPKPAEQKPQPPPQKVAEPAPQQKPPPPAKQPEPAPKKAEAEVPYIATESEVPRESKGIGLYLGATVDPAGKTIGGQASLVFGTQGPWALLVGAAISPHPGFRLSVAGRIAGGDTWALAIEPRFLYSPFSGSSVVGGGVGLRYSMRAGRWINLIASAAGEGYHGPDGTFFAPLLSIGLEPHL